MDKKVRNKLLAEKKQPDIMPFTDILTGTLINIKKAKAFSLQEHLKFEMEADFLLRLTLHHHVESQELLNYEYSQPDASQYQCYQGVYFREWYFDSMDEFLIFLTGFVSGVFLIWHLMTVFLIVDVATSAYHGSRWPKALRRQQPMPPVVQN